MHDNVLNPFYTLSKSFEYLSISKEEVFSGYDPSISSLQNLANYKFTINNEVQIERRERYSFW